MISKLVLVCAVVAGVSAAGSGTAGRRTTAMATIKDASGTTVGRATFTETPAGVLIEGDMTAAPAGTHGIHVHTIGKCDGPGFTSAGGHFNPASKKHGFKNPDGPHMGDMTNITVPASGSYTFAYVLMGATLKGSNALLDADGAAIVLHATQDDYSTDPAGNSGARIACGVITEG